MERFISPRYEQEILTDYPAFVRRIRAGMDDTGMAVLEDFLHPAFLDELRSSVERLTPQCYQNGKRKPLIGKDLADTGFYEVAFSDFMIRLANDILEVFNVQVQGSDIHPAMNILVGDQGQDTVKGWHFDATYLTIAMPVVMPAAGERDGKFRIWPNVRRFSQSPLQNRLYCNLARIDALRRMVRNYAVNFVPGNLYFFYGFRSYHGTDELDNTQLRANCLINFGGPFFDREKGRVIKYAR
ncbi:MAG TPA: hypothetical protein VLW25_13080 [Bryobacteraceae bacterium]|nr:hypothetical protein [Bryobacteraceae bacterium]